MTKLGESDMGESIFKRQDKRQSATEIVMNTIKNLLIKKKLKPGDKLPSETELAENLDVSRGSVREAMKILDAYGIVTIKRGNGTYINESTSSSRFDPLLFKLILNQDSFKELRELREMLEMGIMKLAIENATEEDLESIEEVFKYTKKLVEENKYENEVIVDLEYKFHTCLGNATHNKLVMTIYNYVMELYIPKIYKLENDERFGAEVLLSHGPTVDAIINRDMIAGENAVKYMIGVWKDQAERIQANMK